MRLAIVLAACAMLAQSAAAQEAPAHRVSGSVTISQGQAGFIITAGCGGGVLRYKGKSYRFKIGGLGIGGMGASSLQARGTVYDMGSVKDFPGTYIAARMGAVVGKRSVGKTWLKNSKGVLIELAVQRKGLMLSTGADGVLVSM